MRIGRIESDTLDARRAGAVDEWAAAEGVECLYFLARSDDPASAFAATDAGYRLVDVRVELSRPAAGDDEGSVRVARPSDVGALRDIARVSHGGTRFYADPRFPDGRCDEFYAHWIELSCEGWADAVLVVEAGGWPAGYVTCHADGLRGSIGLIAVEERSRGRGLGRELVAGAVEWMRRSGLETAAVVTQGRNASAQRTFQSVGFRTETVGLWFHKWYAP